MEMFLAGAFSEFSDDGVKGRIHMNLEDVGLKL